MIKVIIGSFLTTVSFGILFNVRGKKVIYAGLIGICAGTTLYGVQKLGVNLIVAQFFAAFVLSGLAELFARKVKTPVTTFIVCALIPLVPGGGMYLAMKALMESDLEKSNQILMSVLAQSGAIALGMVVVSTISIIYRERSRKNRRSY